MSGWLTMAKEGLRLPSPEGAKGGPKAPDNQPQRWQAPGPSHQSGQEPILPTAFLALLRWRRARGT